jgi:dTDP-4-amino-4,6-dideoxygalactose transaminase
MNTNPYQTVIDLENRIAEWAGSEYCVTTDSCTSSMFLSLQWRKKQLGSIGEVTIPAFTYPSAACNIIHCGGKVKFSHHKWGGIYELSPLNIIDSALRFRKGMYIKDTLYCVSMHLKKALPVGRGGAILTDDIEARDWLRKARFDGRSPIPLAQDRFEMLGWNCYLTPEQGARALQLFELIRNKDNQDLRMEDQGYPDLSIWPIYQQ